MGFRKRTFQAKEPFSPIFRSRLAHAMAHSRIVCCRQTIVCSHQTIICCHQTIVWRQQTINKQSRTMQKSAQKHEQRRPAHRPVHRTSRLTFPPQAQCKENLSQPIQRRRTIESLHPKNDCTLCQEAASASRHQAK